MNLTKEFLERVRERLIEDYNAKGLRASGLTAKLLKVVGSGNKWSLQTPDYFIFQILGRGPGEMPPLEEIEKWVISKGLPKGSAKPIAITIGKEGTKIFKREAEGIDLQGIFDEEMKIFLREFGDEQAKEIADVVVQSMLQISVRK